MATERFTKDHEWVRIDGGIATVGITDHAQQQLGDVVFVELPEVGRRKAASDVFSPVAGEVMEVNGDVVGRPALVNEDAEDKAWFFKLKVVDGVALDALMDRAAYEAFVKEGS